ncbi:hypothetical protein ABW20_dc0105800 [Dactylellina cionopaga]|nr:hypothetical protein ABW20_dc0105800 [Dactylellina cionopaga]
MSKPTPGDYVIYNRVLSCTGQKLAITFNKKGGPATVTPLSNSREQIWTISDFSDGATQYVVPKKDSSLQVGWGSSVAVVIPAGEYVWTIRKGEEGFTIQDGDQTQNWGVEKAVVNAKVSISKDTAQPRQRWILEKVRSQGYRRG